MRWTWSGFAVRGSLSLVLLTSTTAAQIVPDLFSDSGISGSNCDLVNAVTNGIRTELVVRIDTSQLVLVGGSDVTLFDTLVDADDFVFFEGDFAGLIDFAEDGDGFRTLWWTSLAGTVVDVDGFTGVPSPTDFLPSDFFDVPCDACEFLDDQSVCDNPLDDDDVIDDPVTVNLCGLNAQLTLPLTALGLSLMGSKRRRWARAEFARESHRFL